MSSKRYTEKFKVEVVKWELLALRPAEDRWSA